MCGRGAAGWVGIAGLPDSHVTAQIAGFVAEYKLLLRDVEAVAALGHQALAARPKKLVAHEAQSVENVLVEAVNVLHFKQRLLAVLVGYFKVVAVVGPEVVAVRGDDLAGALGCQRQVALGEVHLGQQAGGSPLGSAAQVGPAVVFVQGPDGVGQVLNNLVVDLRRGGARDSGGGGRTGGRHREQGHIAEGPHQIEVVLGPQELGLAQATPPDGFAHATDTGYFLQCQVGRADAYVAARPQAAYHGVTGGDVEVVELLLLGPVAAAAAARGGVVRHDFADAPQRVVVLAAPAQLRVGRVGGLNSIGFGAVKVFRRDQVTRGFVQEFFAATGQESQGQDTGQGVFRGK